MINQYLAEPSHKHKKTHKNNTNINSLRNTNHTLEQNKIAQTQNKSCINFKKNKSNTISYQNKNKLGMKTFCCQNTTKIGNKNVNVQNMG